MSDRYLTEEEQATLRPDCLEKYKRAKRYCGNEHAGGFDGWSAGHDLLESLGWEKKIRSSGHRSYQSLVKPENLDHLM